MILRDTQLIILNYKRLENVLRIAYAFQGFMPILVVNNGNSTKLEVSKVLFHNKSGQKLVGRLELPANQLPHNYVLFAHCFTCNKNLLAIKNISKSTRIL